MKEDNLNLIRKGESMLKLRNSKGFALIELMVVIAILGIISSIAIPRFMGSEDRARIGVAEAAINSIRQALALYAVDHSSYPTTAANYSELVSALKDSSGNAYMSIPDTTNFTWSSYSGTDTTYTLMINARDRDKTQLTGTPEGVTR
jgi:type II secretion system protein G